MPARFTRRPAALMLLGSHKIFNLLSGLFIGKPEPICRASGLAGFCGLSKLSEKTQLMRAEHVGSALTGADFVFSREYAKETSGGSNTYGRIRILQANFSGRNERF